MKKITLLFLTLCFVCLQGFSQNAEIPAVVKNSFNAKFPGVKKVEWKLKTDKNYEAEFDWKGAETAVKFDKDGKWLETEWAIKESELPDAVKKQITASFANYKIIETQKVEGVAEKAVFYEVHLDNGKEVAKVQLAANGDIKSKSSKPSKPKK